MKTTLTAFLLLLVSAAALAQSGGKIAGTVKDRASGEALPGANIVVKGTRYGASADVEGRYFILDVPPGTYDVSASLIGYGTVTKTKVIVNLNRTVTVDFALSQAAVDIGEEVIVVAERPDVPRERTSSSEIVRSEEVALTPGIQNLTDVLGLSADVTDGHFRGGRENEELYTLAGMGIVNPLTAAAAFAPIVSAVEEVEVITSGFGAQFGNAQSGVINISMKEGSPSKWRARLEARSRLPGYKHWGNPVFDVSSNPYLQLLDEPSDWLGLDTSRGLRYFATIGYGFTTMYRDSTQAAAIAYMMWQQARSDLNREYDDLWDGSFDVNLGGPLGERTTIFLAGRVSNEWADIPAAKPDVTRQAMGNVVFDLTEGRTLRFSGAYTNAEGRVYRGIDESSYSDYRYWLWDRMVGGSEVEDNNLQLGVRFAQTLSKASFYEVKVNGLWTHREEGPPVLDPSRYRDDISDGGVWRYFESPDFFRVAHMDNQILDEKTRTVSLDGGWTSQLDPAHLVNTGLQLNLYEVDVSNAIGLSSPPQANDELYAAHPVELGVYFQDKMEFESLIANVGLRWDLYNQNTEYYVDPFYPVEGQPTAETPTIGRLQPRLGISFPVSVGTVFHLNYGAFLQRPSFERTVFSRVNRSTGAPVRLGNPTLKPQDTKSYEVGVTQALGEGFTLDLSGYYKDVSNLIERAYFYNDRGLGLEFYETYVNRDYADIRGFRVGLTRRKGFLTGSLKYNYGVATGKSSTPFDASPVYREDPNAARPDDNPDPRDVLLDFDRTHNAILTLTATSPDDFGPSIGDAYPFGLITLGIKSFARSGRPYTYNAPTDETGMLFNKRSPAEYGTDIRITKIIPRLFGTRAQIYLEVFNLFNQRIYSYNTVFRNDINVQKYHENPDALRFFDVEPQFPADQEFLLYSNSPRSFILGIVLDL